MRYLTQKELVFWNALIEDYKINKEKRFIECLFLGALVDSKEMKEELEELFEGSYKELFNNSDLLMFSVNSCYIGKYKETFWGTGSEGEIFGLGKEIQNIVFPLIFLGFGDVKNKEEKKDICESRHSESVLLINKTIVFCQSATRFQSALLIPMAFFWFSISIIVI